MAAVAGHRVKADEEDWDRLQVGRRGGRPSTA